MNTIQKIQDVELEIVSSKHQVEAVISSTIGRGDRLEDILDKAENLNKAENLSPSNQRFQKTYLYFLAYYCHQNFVAEKLLIEYPLWVVTGYLNYPPI